MQSSDSANPQNLTIKEIILFFSDIDVKISALNECSSNDFATLNGYLKKYYTQTGTITENTNKIFEIVSGNKYNSFCNGLNRVQNLLSDNIETFKDKILKSIRGLEKMITALNLMLVPTKNLNLNLLTLNFLLVNLKLNLAYSGNNFRPEMEEEIDKAILLIDDLKQILPEISNNLLKVKNVSRISSAKLISIRKRNMLDINKVINHIKTSSDILEAIKNEADKRIPQLHKHTENYSDSINKIITNLQYSDIIKQKMEHVQATHKNIITELNSLDQTNLDRIAFSDTAQQFLQIRDIAGLQIAHLISTNKEYQQAFALITKKFWDISDEILAIAALSSDFIITSDEFANSFYTEIEEKLKYVTILLRRIIAANFEFNNEMSLINQTIEKKEQLINKLLNVLSKLNTQVNFILEKINISFADDKVIIHILTEVQNLLSIVLENGNDTQLFYKQALNLSNKLINLNKNSDGEINNNLSDLSEKVNTLINNFSNQNIEIEKIITQTLNQSIQTSSEIKSSIEQVKYYDFFEKIIQEILSELNKIYLKLDAETILVLKQNENDGLKSLMDRYTMESQRIIHNSYFEGLEQISGTPADLDIELF